MAEEQIVDDVALLEAWSRGERASGEALFERYYSSIARFFHTKADEAAQEDLVHETFLACLKNAERCHRQASFRSYLFGIAYNVLTDYLQLSPTSSEQRSCFLQSPAAATVQDEERQLLVEALRCIPLRDQIVLELYYWRDLTVAEIGEVLGVPLDTAETWLCDGRAHLEAQLRKIAPNVDVSPTVYVDVFFAQQASAPEQQDEDPAQLKAPRP